MARSTRLVQIPRAPDWSSLMLDLAEHMTQREIAQRVGVSRSSLYRALHDPNYQPLYPVGARLIALWTVTLRSKDPG